MFITKHFCFCFKSTFQFPTYAPSSSGCELFEHPSYFDTTDSKSDNRLAPSDPVSCLCHYVSLRPNAFQATYIWTKFWSKVQIVMRIRVLYTQTMQLSTMREPFIVTETRHIKVDEQSQLASPAVITHYQGWRNDSRGGGTRPWGPLRKRVSKCLKGPKTTYTTIAIAEKRSKRSKKGPFRYILCPPGPTQELELMGPGGEGPSRPPPPRFLQLCPLLGPNLPWIPAHYSVLSIAAMSLSNLSPCSSTNVSIILKEEVVEEDDLQ